MSMAGSIDYVSFPCFTDERKTTLPSIFGFRFPLTSSVVSIGEYVQSIRSAVMIGMRCPIASSKRRLRSWFRVGKHSRGAHVRLVDEDEVDTEGQFQQESPPADSTSTSSEAITTTQYESRGPPASTESTSNSSISPPTKPQTRTSSFSSLASIPSKLKRTLSNRFHRPKQPSQLPAPPPSTPPAASQTSLIATLDALALSPPDLATLQRMELICHAAHAARDRRSPKPHNTPTPTSSANLPLRLRGGSSPPPPFRPRTTLPPFPRPPPTPDSTRPSGLLWWLAGGRVSQHGRVPTVGELRARREVEAANRRKVGFWGTVVGWRGVGRVGVLGDGGEGDGGGEGGEGGCGDAGSVWSNGASGLEGGGGGEGSDVEAARSRAGSALGEGGEVAEGEDGGGENCEGKDGGGHGGGENGTGAAAKNL